jgi:hypothetical protein
MGKLCLAILRAAPAPMRMREIVAAVAAEKRLDGSDRALMLAVTGRARGALGATNRRGVTRLVGPTTSKRVRWSLTQ